MAPTFATSDARWSSVMSATCFASCRNRSRLSAARCFCSAVGSRRAMLTAPGCGAETFGRRPRPWCPAGHQGQERGSDGRSGEHVARVDGREHGPEVVAVCLRELDVALDGEPVDPLGLGDLLGALRKGAGQVAAREIKAQTAAQQRGSVVV